MDCNRPHQFYKKTIQTNTILLAGTKTRQIVESVGIKPKWLIETKGVVIERMQ